MLLNSINDIFKLINPNQLCEYEKNIQYLKEKFSKRKIRISFLGTINSGKSIILNTLIGENVLPLGMMKALIEE